MTILFRRESEVDDFTITLFQGLSFTKYFFIFWASPRFLSNNERIGSTTYFLVFAVVTFYDWDYVWQTFYNKSRPFLVFETKEMCQF